MIVNEIIIHKIPINTEANIYRSTYGSNNEQIAKTICKDMFAKRCVLVFITLNQLKCMSIVNTIHLEGITKK